MEFLLLQIDNNKKQKMKSAIMVYNLIIEKCIYIIDKI